MNTKRVSAAVSAAAVGACFVMWASACGPSAPPPTRPAPPPVKPLGSGEPSGDQVEHGAELFGAHCAKCHGAQGEGNEAKGVPALVGADALPLDPPPGAKRRKNQFKTAQDVFDFVHVNMPADKPGSLEEDQYWAILAFALSANGVDMTGRRIDASNASTFVLHP